jgi:hypothetical protein
MLSFGRAARAALGSAGVSSNDAASIGVGDDDSADADFSAEEPAETVRRLRLLLAEISAALERLAAVVEASARNESSYAADVEPAAGTDWRGLLFETTSPDEPPQSDLQALINGLTHGDAGAVGLVGRLLAFQSAEAEELPVLLKDVGEAYYRWSNRLDFERVALREALIRRLIAACSRAGLGHRIETVRVGDRFDRSRHQTATGGWELTAVRGWVVLRENGSVYTKADVETR